MNSTFELECMEDDLTHESNFVEWQGLKVSGSKNGHKQVARPSEQLPHQCMDVLWARIAYK